MSARGILLLASLSMGAAGCVAYAQPYPPPGPPPDQGGYDQGYPSDQAYGDPGYQDQGAYADQGYDQGYDQDTQDAYSGQPVSVDFFYRQLSPYGDWIQRPGYGWVWYPGHVPAGWRPYRYGRWVETEYGWTWVSQEPFGWATYHYGRWTLDPEYGWVWVPGTEWGPAWVAFQQGNGYIGWAPLPPSVGFRAGIGLDFGGINLSVSLGPSWYNFVPERQFLAASVSSYCLPPARNVTIIRNTTNITSYRVVNNRIVNQSMPVQRIEQVTGQRVQRFRVADATTTAQGRTPRIQGDQITVFRPRVSTAKPVLPPPQAIAQQRPARGPRQPGRVVQPGTQPPPPAQPGNAPQAANVQQPTPRQGNGRYRRPATPDEVQRQNDQEQRDLAKHQADEQRQIDQIHRQEQEQARSQPAQAAELQRRHQAEAQALRDQHQREQQQLEAKHQREQQNVRGQAQQPQQPKQQPPPPRQNQDKNKNNQDKNKDKNRPQDEQKPPPQR
jgi:hypothetical protein